MAKRCSVALLEAPFAVSEEAALAVLAPRWTDDRDGANVLRPPNHLRQQRGNTHIEEALDNLSQQLTHVDHETSTQAVPHAHRLHRSCSQGDWALHCCTLPTYEHLIAEKGPHDLDRPPAVLAPDPEEANLKHQWTQTLPRQLLPYNMKNAETQVSALRPIPSLALWHGGVACRAWCRQSLNRPELDCTWCPLSLDWPASGPSCGSGGWEARATGSGGHLSGSA